MQIGNIIPYRLQITETSLKAPLCVLFSSKKERFGISSKGLKKGRDMTVILTSGY
jgi:hypothetical protein